MSWPNLKVEVGSPWILMSSFFHHFAWTCVPQWFPILQFRKLLSRAFTYERWRTGDGSIRVRFGFDSDLEIWVLCHFGGHRIFETRKSFSLPARLKVWLVVATNAVANLYECELIKYISGGRSSLQQLIRQHIVVLLLFRSVVVHGWVTQIFVTLPDQKFVELGK